ncbi:hypothetical protein CHUAL_002518 [Chamberlinius hualienensis]
MREAINKKDGSDMKKKKKRLCKNDLIDNLCSTAKTVHLYTHIGIRSIEAQRCSYNFGCSIPPFPPSLKPKTYSTPPNTPIKHPPTYISLRRRTTDDDNNFFFFGWDGFVHFRCLVDDDDDDLRESSYNVNWPFHAWTAFC